MYGRKMAEQIAEILKGPNFQTAEKALTDFCGPMDGEFRNLLVDIIVERWIDTPKERTVFLCPQHLESERYK